MSILTEKSNSFNKFILLSLIVLCFLFFGCTGTQSAVGNSTTPSLSTTGLGAGILGGVAGSSIGGNGYQSGFGSSNFVTPTSTTGSSALNDPNAATPATSTATPGTTSTDSDQNSQVSSSQSGGDSADSSDADSGGDDGGDSGGDDG